MAIPIRSDTGFAKGNPLGAPLRLIDVLQDSRASRSPLASAVRAFAAISKSVKAWLISATVPS